jgi:hypothetical protein
MDQVRSKSSLPARQNGADAVVWSLGSARTWLLMVIGAVLAIYLAFLWLGPIVRGDDTTNSFMHLDVWSTALRAGNPLPVWASEHANGFGSPMPFFYHKLFNLVGAIFVLLTADTVTGFRCAVFVFSVVQLTGAYQCARRLELGTLSSIAAAAACLLAPYAINNMVIRGAVAEYSAMALVPWILLLVLDFHLEVHRKWHAFMLFAVLGLLALAHVLIFVAVAGLLLGLSLYWIVTGHRGRLTFALVIGASVLAFAMLFYVPFAYWSVLFCPDQARIFGKSADNLVPVLTLLQPLPRTGLGWPGLALLVAMTAKLRRVKSKSDNPAFALGTIAIFLMLVTTSVAAPLWRLSSLFDFFQFPWRVLAVATPLAIIALFGLMENIEPVQRQRLQIWLLLIALVSDVISINSLKSPPPYSRTIPLAELRHQVPSSTPNPDANGEYFPAAYQNRLRLVEIKAWGEGLDAVLPARRPLVEAHGCEVADMVRPPYFELLRISGVCTQLGRIRVNQFATPFLDSVATDDTGRMIHPDAKAQIIEFTLPPGHWTILVRQRRYDELVRMAWFGKLGI